MADSPDSKERTCANIDKELKAAWVERFGEYGSYSWLFETIMRQMLAMCKASPTVELLINRAIQEHISALAAERGNGSGTQTLSGP